MDDRSRPTNVGGTEKIAVIGPGIVGMPMAALLADAGRRIPSPFREVVVVQRASATSGWKVEAINAGRSPIGGIEPELDRVVAETVRDGRLRATHDPAELSDADVILICVQTDKAGIGPDYGPLYEALDGVCAALQHRPAGKVPLIIFESTLAPSSMTTLIRERFARAGLIEGRDVRLGNSPNRVMPGRLVERVASADKIVAGLDAATAEQIEHLYAGVVTRGTLYPTNSLTAEIVKTLENAYRDVRIAYAAEVVRWCDAEDVDFYALRDQVNAELAQQDAASSDPGAVPSGGLLVPTIGVGGHCLPKDGILLWWRALEGGADPHDSLIIEARRINDESPGQAVSALARLGSSLTGRRVALLGTAYRFDSEDTRNSPTLQLALALQNAGAEVRLHDPYVYPEDQNLRRSGLTGVFTRELREALGQAEIAVICTSHRVYRDHLDEILAMAPQLRIFFDGSNAFPGTDLSRSGLRAGGIGRGRRPPDSQLVADTLAGFRAMERGVANEVSRLVDFLNARYAPDEFNRASYPEVQRLAGTCVTGCALVAPGPIEPAGGKLRSRLAEIAARCAPSPAPAA